MGKRTSKSKTATKIETDPEKLALPLLDYAYRYAASIGWQVKDRAIARGQGIEDIVQDALASLYGGEEKRRWKPEEVPNPMDHLRSFVNSRLSSLARSYDHRFVKYPIDPERHPHTDDPEELAMAKHEQQLEDEWREKAHSLLLDEILDDDLLLKMHDLMEKEEIDKPADLAKRLGESVEAIKNAKKRISRAWRRVVRAIGPPPAFGSEALHD